jgi:NADPH:quinone reductase-like Zn-dependent oxidoreductase
MAIMYIMHDPHTSLAASFTVYAERVHKKEGSVEQRNASHNKRVVILGGSSGIGLSVAEQAASQGAKLVIASSNRNGFRRRSRSWKETHRDTHLI